MAVILALFYGLFALVAVTNLLLMRHPGRTKEGPSVVVLIPARNEAHNLAKLLPELVPQAPVYVFDDESNDDTGAVAQRLGATVVHPREPLPAGWAGKNRACHELAKAADPQAEWLLFLDADVRVTPDFMDAVRSLCREVGDRCGAISGFPTIVPGRGIEPLFLAWVGWILLSTNPFGIVSRTKKGHNRFTNGQFHLWKREVYTRLWPNEAVKGHIMEDVMMGRLLAKAGVPVEVANVSKVLSVRMYETWRQTLDGMSKNSFEVTHSAHGSYGLALFFLVIAWGWLLAPWTYGLLLVSGVASAAVVRARPVGYLFLIFALPLALSIGAYTMVRSVAWRRKGIVTWKGRLYK